MNKKQQVKILATAVIRALQEKNKKDATAVVENFLLYLKQHHYLYLLKDILAALKVLDDEAHNTLAVEISSAHPLHKETINVIDKYLQKHLNKDISIEETIDANLLGGLKIKYQDQVLDLSIKKQINNLNKSLVN